MLQGGRFFRRDLLGEYLLAVAEPRQTLRTERCMRQQSLSLLRRHVSDGQSKPVSYRRARAGSGRGKSNGTTESRRIAGGGIRHQKLEGPRESLIGTLSGRAV